MVRNEFVKFARPNVMIINFIIILSLISLFGLLVASDSRMISNEQDIQQLSMMVRNEFIYYLFPLLIAFLVSNIFSKDIYGGELKFFMNGRNNRINILGAKTFIVITLVLVFIILVDISSIMVVSLALGRLSGIKDIQALAIVRNILYTLYILLPLLMVFIFISIMTKHSIMVSISIFFVFMAADQMAAGFNKYIPTGMIKTYIFKEEFLLWHATIFTLILAGINSIIFQRKDMLE